MKYTLIIKSHCDAPDLEDEVEAKTRQEAIEELFKYYGKYGWEKKQITDNVISDNEWNKIYKMILK